MGFGGISVWQLLIVLVIVVLIFGTKKLRGMGGDLGSAVKSFKKAVKEEPGASKDKEGEEKSEEESVAEIQTDGETAGDEKEGADKEKSEKKDG